MRKLVSVLLAAVPLAAAAQEAPAGATGPAPAEVAPPPSSAAPLRDGVYAGIGLGAVRFGAPSEDDGLAYRFRIGVARSPRVMLGLEASLADGASTQLTSYELAATVFPARRIFFLRGGFGLAELHRLQQLSGPGGTFAAEEAERGFDVLAGLGVQLGRTDGVNVTANLEHRFLRISRPGGDARNYGSLSAWLGLEWH